MLLGKRFFKGPPVPFTAFKQGIKESLTEKCPFTPTLSFP